MLKERIVRSVLKPTHQTVQGIFFREVVGNPKLHVFMLKHYQYLDGFAAARLRKVARLLHDSELKRKVECHVVDEDKHASFFRRRIIELGGSPTLTPDELRFGFLDRFNSHGLGISDERLDEDKFLDVRELIRFFVLLKAEEEFGLRFFLGHLQGSGSDPTTKAMLEEVVEDEHRHVAYLAEELTKLGQTGVQSCVDEESERCRKNFVGFRVPRHELFRILPTLLDMVSYRPVGRTISACWFFVSPLLRVAAKTA